jgi:DNA-binding winged helix-turn-helix (wHTH) protein/Tfp pilus assembly protein PilF
VDVRATNGLVVVCFDRFEVNLRTGDVHRNGTPVTLQEQPLRILIRLLEAPGEIVTRDDLRACLWATDTFVDFEHGLNTAIKRLRDALGDSATEPRYIETIPHRGYRFVATVTTDAAGGSTGVSRRLALSRAIAALVVAIAIAAAWQFGRAHAGAPAPAATAGQSIASAAYSAYMQGLVASHRWQAGGCVDAETHLLEAIAIDPNAADAYAQLAFCYVFPDRLRRPGWETGPKARAAVDRALALDPRSSLAHLVAGQLKMRHDFDWDAARSEFRQAVTLNPKDPQALNGYGEFLYASGRDEQGLAVLRDGLALDPLDMNHQTAFGFALRNLHRFDDAVQQLQRTVENDPSWLSARFWLAYTEGDRGHHDAAVSEYLTFLSRVVVPSREGVVEDLRATYAHAGWIAFWRAELALAEQDNRAPGSVWREPASYYSGPYSMARRYARLGGRQAALDWLEKSCAYRHHLMVFIGLEPLFEILHVEPRFKTLLTRVGAHVSG